MESLRGARASWRAAWAHRTSLVWLLLWRRKYLSEQRAAPARCAQHRDRVPRDSLARMRQALSALAALICVGLLSFSAFAANVDYEFNSKGQLVRALYSDGTVVTYEYDENGNRRSVTST